MSLETPTFGAVGGGVTADDVGAGSSLLALGGGIVCFVALLPHDAAMKREATQVAGSFMTPKDARASALFTVYGREQRTRAGVLFQ